MSSAVVYEALTTDPVLIAQGIDRDSVFTDYSSEVVPRQDLFVILRWGNQLYRAATRTGPTVLTVWVHQPVEMGSDYTEINKIHDQIRRVLTDLAPAIGADDVGFVTADFDGLGGNMEDPGFHTITRNAGYRVLLNRVW